MDLSNLRWILLSLSLAACGASSSSPSDHDGPPPDIAIDDRPAPADDASASSTARKDAATPQGSQPDVDASSPAHTPSTASDAGSTIPSTPRGAADAATPEGTPTLFFLDALGGRVLTVAPDGNKSSAVVQNQRATPDGVAVDVAGGRIYWTNMGVPTGDDGTILSTKLDGSDLKTVVPSGGTFTPKQLTLDAANGLLYWSDREGMRVMRSKLDGSSIETLVTIAQGDSARTVDSNWAVGIGLDVAGGYVYWTQKGADNAGQGSLRRAPIALSSGEASDKRSDIEILFQSLPEPIDLALDLQDRKVYWTDRGDNTVSRASMDLPAGSTAATRTDREKLVSGLNEAIGITLDLRHGNVYYTDLGGLVGTCKLDGSGQKTVVSGQGSLTGITYVELSK
jgi:DNA-binding beta-propeller fold protein YncE